MKRTHRLVFIVLVACLLLPAAVRAGELDQGKQMMAAGDLEGAAEFFNRYALSHPNDATSTPEALVLAGRILDALVDQLTGKAEKSCYWGKGGSRSPDCMQRFVDQYNARFGSGAFRYEHAVLYIPYTGLHYKMLASRFPKSPYAAEADFYLLLRDLIGHPDTVLPKVKAYLAKYPKGDWGRKGLLLWARVNEDVWYVHRKWSWVLYNYQLSPEDLIIKAEPYRQEALRTYERLLKDKGTWEASVAEREYTLLKNNQEDPAVFSIVNDSNPGALSSWGVAAPLPPQAPPDRGAGFGNQRVTPAPQGSSVPGAQAPAPPAVEMPSAPAEEPVKAKVPSRWN